MLVRPLLILRKFYYRARNENRRAWEQPECRVLEPLRPSASEQAVCYNGQAAPCFAPCFSSVSFMTQRREYTR